MTKLPVQKGEVNAAPKNGTTRKQWSQAERVADQARENAMIRDYQTPKFHKPKQ